MPLDPCQKQTNPSRRTTFKLSLQKIPQKKSQATWTHKSISEEISYREEGESSQEQRTAESGRKDCRW